MASSSALNTNVVKRIIYFILDETVQAYQNAEIIFNPLTLNIDYDISYELGEKYKTTSTTASRNVNSILRD